jgi:hypothetical protein
LSARLQPAYPCSTHLDLHDAVIGLEREFLLLTIELLDVNLHGEEGRRAEEEAAGAVAGGWVEEERKVARRGKALTVRADKCDANS